VVSGPLGEVDDTLDDPVSEEPPTTGKPAESAPASKARGTLGAMRIASSGRTARISSPSFTRPPPERTT